MIFDIEYKSNFIKAFTWLIVLAILSGLLMAFFPLMQENDILSLLEGFEESVSPAFAQMLGLSKETDYQAIDHFLPFISQYLMVLMAIFAIQMGSASLSKEQSQGTIEYLYSHPVTRSDIVTDKWMANLGHYILVTLLLLLANFAFAYLFSPKPFPMEATALSLLRIGACYLGIGVFFLFLGYLYSALSSRSSHAEGGSFLLVLVVLALYFVGIYLGSAYGNFYQFTPFYAFNALGMIHSPINILSIVVSLVLALIFLGLTYLIYNKKDLKF
ncbi:MAG: ABC transporter permease subunit [Tissierellia bacterium]|nr:ABC transporter permease subunit [Tissierellia bacterium]